MDLAALAVFTTALLIAAASPGPGIAALVARVLGRGRDGAAAFAAGLILGDLVWLAAAVLGLSVVAHSFHGLFLAIKYGGAAYLLWLAWKLWTAPAASFDGGAVERDHPLRLFLGGLAVTLGNPKVMVFYLALLPGLIDIARIDAAAYAELAAIIVAVLVLVFGAYALMALRARALLRNSRMVRLVNRGTGALMAGAAVAVASR
jgi:threonine/homoserine/homoserine lactone efflux protein